MKRSILLFCIFLSSIMITSACSPAPYTDIHLGNLRATENNNLFRFDVYPSDLSIGDTVTKIVDVRDGTVAEDTDIANSDISEMKENAYAGDMYLESDIEDGNVSIYWEVLQNEQQIYNVSIHMDDMSTFPPPINFMNMYIGAAYLVYSNASLYEMDAYVLLTPDMETLETTTSKIAFFDFHEPYTTVWEELSIIKIQVACCPCYANAYYKIVNETLVFIENDLSKSVFMDSRENKLITLFERNYTLGLWNLENMNYSSILLDYDTIARDVGTAFISLQFNYVLLLIMPVFMRIKRNM